jgi:putative protease
MCAISSLQKLIYAGITSFKIEGRMRQADYVEGVTKVYRKYIDTIISNIKNSEYKLNDSEITSDEKSLLKLYDKGGFTNYYDKHNDGSMIQRYDRRYNYS